MDAIISKAAAAKSAAPLNSLFELPNMQLPKFDLSNMEVLEAFREIAEKGVAQTKDAYEKMKAAAEEAGKLLEDVYATGAKGALAYNRKVLEAGRSNVNAGLDYARALSAAKSLNEVVELPPRMSATSSPRRSNRPRNSWCSFGIRRLKPSSRSGRALTRRSRRRRDHCSRVGTAHHLSIPLLPGE